MKKRFIRAILSIIVAAASSGVTFAADQSACTTCSSTSPIVEQYINFSYEIIKTLQTIANEKLKKSDGSSVNEANVLEKIANNLNQKSQTALTFSVMMGTIGTQIITSSSRQELQVMTNSKALMRDWEKLDQLDQDISDTLLELGQAGVFISNVDEYKTRIKDIFKKYGDMKDSFLTVQGEPSSSASVLVSALWDINQAYKRFIAGGNTDGFAVFSKKYGSTLGITLSQINYDVLPEQYKCTRGFNKCDTTYKRFGQNMSEISTNAKSQTKEAIDTVKLALQRLKCAFAKQSNVKCQQAGFTEKQNDLLRGLYGLAGPLANKQGTNALASSMKGLGNSLAGQINDVKDFYTRNDNQSSSIELPQTALLDVSKPDFSSQKSSDDLYADLMSSMNTTLAQSKKTWQQHVLADPVLVTSVVPRNSIMVYSAINIIGDAQKAKSITQNLGKACENQCSNLGGTCYY